MPLPAKTIRAKIKTVGNIKKITKAMEKVASVKMRRSVRRALATRDYAFHVYELLDSVLGHDHLRHPLLRVGVGAGDLVVAISSNRGLSGSLNTQLGRAVETHLAAHADRSFDMVAVGKKMERLATRLGRPLVASFVNVPDSVHVRDVLPLVRFITDQFASGRYARIWVAYSHFGSALSFVPVVRQLLPLDQVALRKYMERVFQNRLNGKQAKFYEYTFEPGEEAVLDFVLPKIIEVKIYKMLLESRACEHSARMVAMKSASENAQSLMEGLSVSYNRARQDAITREIAEIVQ